MLGRLGGWRPVLAALSVVLSALIGLATNVVTESGTIALVVTVGGLVALAATLAWYDSRPRPTLATQHTPAPPATAAPTGAGPLPALQAVLRAELARIASTPRLLVVCGYDGTLVHDARPVPQSLAALEHLARLPQTTAAVISGRALRDLVASSRLSDHVRLVGSHGAEFDLTLADSLPAPLHHSLVRAVLGLVAKVPAARMEIKPASVAVHFGKPDPKASQALRSGPGSQPGINVIEYDGTIELSVLPPDNGRALERLRAETEADAVVYLGGTAADVPNLARLRDGDLRVQTLKPQGVAAALELLVRYRRRWLDSARVVEIERHSLLSGGGTVALLTPGARVTWLCHPRPHSAAVFADLLGGPAAGHFTVEPVHGATPLHQRYRPGTMTLETRWPGLTVTDWLDEDPRNTVLLRLLRGHGLARVEFAPRPEFGRLPIHLQPVGDGLLVLGSNQPMALRANGIEWHIRSGDSGQSAHANIDLSACGGEAMLELRLGTDDLAPHPQTVAVRLEGTESAWTGWARTLTLPELAADEVQRSALTMRALCFRPTGAMLASATTSLPQSIGGVRNWDYRYCWLRDAAISAQALVGLGSRTEAEALLGWIAGRSRSESGNLARLRPVYTVDGEDIPGEATIDELPGYAGSRPVRIGNGAYRFLQLDVFGAVAELIAMLAELRPPTDDDLTLLEQLVEVVARRWHEPDHGIWEIRMPPRHHVHSKVMCWLAVDRALRVCRRNGRPEAASWLDLRERIAGNVLTRGWDSNIGAFTTAYGEPALDAGTLWVGLSGLVSLDDPRFRTTVRAVAKQLRLGPTVLPHQGKDSGLPGIRGGFHLCTAWLVEALARTGRPAEARELFDAMLTCLGPTGLLPEGYDPVAERGAGNHPQAFSHAGLVHAALALDRCR